MVTTFRPAPNVVELSARFGMNDVPCENVYHIQFPAPPTVTDLQTCCSVYASTEAAHLAVTREGDTAFLGCLARDLSVQEGAEFQTTAHIGGTLTGGLLPNHCSLALKWGTGKAGRSNRGRTFHIGLGNIQLDSSTPNAVSSAAASDIVNAYQFLISAAWPSSSFLAVLHTKKGGSFLDPRTTTKITTVNLADFFVDSQRRRLPGHNRHR